MTEITVNRPTGAAISPETGHPVIAHNTDELIAACVGVTGCLMELATTGALIYARLGIAEFLGVATVGAAFVGVALGYLYKRDKYDAKDAAGILQR